MKNRIIATLLPCVFAWQASAQPVAATSAAPAETNQVRLIVEEPVALAAILDLINNAQKSIDFAYYVFDPSNTSTKLIINALITAVKDRKVTVRAVLDAYDLNTADPVNNKDPRNLANLAAVFKTAGITLRYFNPPTKESTLFPAQIDTRNHMKFIVADGAKAYVGSRNIGDEHFGLRKQYDYTDRDLLVEGAGFAQQVEDTFEELLRATDMVIDPAEVPGALQKADPNWVQEVYSRGDVQGPAVLADVQGPDSLGMKKLAQLPVRQCANMQFISDSPAYKHVVDVNLAANQEKQKRATMAYLSFIESKTLSQLEIENWAYAPAGWEESDGGFAMIRQSKGVQVLTNKTAFAGGEFDALFNDNIQQAAEADSNGNELVMQVSPLGGLTAQKKNAWDKTPPAAPWAIHEKIAIRDNSNNKDGGKDILVGSFNLDARSYQINLEDVTIVNDCKDLASDLEKNFLDLRSIYNTDRKNCPDCTKGVSETLLQSIEAFLTSSEQ